ncbi:MAG: hypothetical protein Q4F79_11735 [Eubacteriales bacterium]|nr:hypothetical protein [Eubacteriales bacterium]
MRDQSQYFLRSKPDDQKLLQYGFSQTDHGYRYQTELLDGQFRMTVVVTDTEVQTELFDLENECEYILHHVGNAQGEFVGKVRSAHENVLADLRDQCFVSDVFHSADAQAIIQYVSDKYGDSLEFLWQKFPNNAVYRRKDNRKWYAAILTVAKSKLGLEGEDRLEILDLRISPEQLEQTIDHKPFSPDIT